jgi:hypothetical protein
MAYFGSRLRSAEQPVPMQRAGQCRERTHRAPWWPAQRQVPGHSSRLSYGKNSTSTDFGCEVAHRYRSLEEMPKERLPIQIMSGSTRPAPDPATCCGRVFQADEGMFKLFVEAVQ